MKDPTLRDLAPDLAARLDPFSMVDEAEPLEGPLKVFVEKRRYGKSVTVVIGFSRAAKLDELARFLKNAVAAGGTSGEGRIELQGDHARRVAELLREKGYRLTA